MGDSSEKKNVIKEITKSVSTAKKVKKGVQMGLKALDVVAPGSLEIIGSTLENAQDKFDEKIGNKLEDQIDKFQEKIDEVIGDKIEQKIDDADATIRQKTKNLEENFQKTLVAFDDKVITPIKEKTKPLIGKIKEKTTETIKSIKKEKEKEEEDN